MEIITYDLTEKYLDHCNNIISGFCGMYDPEFFVTACNFFATTRLTQDESDTPDLFSFDFRNFN